MKTILTLALSTVFSIVASATLIDSGTINITGTGPTGNFNFSGSGFTVSGLFSSGNWQPTLCNPCSPGTVLGVNGTVVGNDFSTGNATIGATNFAGLAWGDLNAAGPSAFTITGPAVTLNAGPGTYRSTFTFSGSLCGTQGGSVPHPCVVNLPSLSGYGIVDVRIANVPGGLLQYTSATYTFTPEPSAWLLAGAGFMAMLALRRRQ